MVGQRLPQKPNNERLDMFITMDCDPYTARVLAVTLMVIIAAFCWHRAWGVRRG